MSDFLSIQKTDDSNPHEIISISFSLRRVLHENYYKLDMTEMDKYLVQTRSQTKSSGVKVPEVQGIDKGFSLHVKPEQPKSVIMLPTQQIQSIDNRLPTDIKLPIPIPKPRIGQGRVGLRRKPMVTLPHQCQDKPLSHKQ